MNRHSLYILIVTAFSVGLIGCSSGKRPRDIQPVNLPQGPAVNHQVDANGQPLGEQDQDIIIENRVERLFHSCVPRENYQGEDLHSADVRDQYTNRIEIYTEAERSTHGTVGINLYAYGFGKLLFHDVNLAWSHDEDHLSTLSFKAFNSDEHERNEIELIATTVEPDAEVATGILNIVSEREVIIEAGVAHDRVIRIESREISIPVSCLIHRDEFCSLHR